MEYKDTKLILRIAEMPEIKDNMVGVNAYDMTLQSLVRFWNRAQLECIEDIKSFADYLFEEEEISYNDITAFENIIGCYLRNKILKKRLKK